MSGRFEQSDVDRVRDATDLVELIGSDIALQARGREHVGLCPFHDDHRPSFAVVTHKGNAFYKCHSCGAAGDAFNFVMDYHKMTFGEALKHLAERAGVELRPQRSSRGDDSNTPDPTEANALAAAFFRQTLDDSIAGEAARGIIDTRGIDAQIADVFNLGVAPDAWDGLLQFAQRKGVSASALHVAGLVRQRTNGSGHYDTFRNRLIFPICDELGRPIAFGGRQITADDDPKYLNSPESPVFNKSKTLFGLHLAKRSIIEHKQVIVTEGYTDVLACHQAGFTTAVATLGTALTEQHVIRLRRFATGLTIVVVFDPDKAGKAAAGRGSEQIFGAFLARMNAFSRMFIKQAVDVRVCILPAGLDPADLLSTDAGKAQFAELVKNAKLAFDYLIDDCYDRVQAASSVSAKRAELRDGIERLAGLGVSEMRGVDRAPIIEHFAQRLNVRSQDVEATLSDIAAQPRRHKGPASTGTTDPELIARDDEVVVSAARGRAEHDLLAVLIAEPSARRQTIESPDHGHRTVTGVFSAEDFADPSARQLASVVFRQLDANPDFAVQDLLRELDDPALRSLVGRLHEQGERRCDQPERTPAEVLIANSSALIAAIGRDRYEREMATLQASDPKTSSRSALELAIQRRREQGDIPAAMPMSVRS